MWSFFIYKKWRISEYFFKICKNPVQNKNTSFKYCGSIFLIIQKVGKSQIFLFCKGFLVSKWTNYQIIKGIRGDNTILDNLKPFWPLSEHSHILAMSISYVEGGTLWTNEFEKLSVQWKAQYSICRSSPLALVLLATWWNCYVSELSDKHTMNH